MRAAHLAQSPLVGTRGSRGPRTGDAGLTGEEEGQGNVGRGSEVAEGQNMTGLRGFVRDWDICSFSWCEWNFLSRERCEQVWFWIVHSSSWGDEGARLQGDTCGSRDCGSRD